MSAIPCGATTKRGGICGVHRYSEDANGCVWHATGPAADEMREKFRRAGTLKSMANRKLAAEAPAAPTNLAECVSFQGWIVAALAHGKLDTDTAKVLSGCVKEVERLLGVRDAEGKLADLVARADALKHAK
jgi:hypothetical protein